MSIPKIPIVIGVTGHRHLREDEIEMLRRKIREIFIFLRKHYPDTPLQILSPLAEGADRLVAQEALKLKQEGHPDIHLITPLPLPKEEYEKDFKTPEVKKEFNELLDQVEEEDCFVLGYLEGNDAENTAKHGIPRSRQYGFVGAYIARHSHILIALWDGKHDPNNVGGTCQVVHFRLFGDMNELPAEYKPPANPLDFVDTGSVCHIKVSRRPRPRTDGTPEEKPFFDAGEIRIRFPGREDEPEIKLDALRSPAFEALNLFNKDAAVYSYSSRSVQLRKRAAEILTRIPGFTEKNSKFRNRIIDLVNPDVRKHPPEPEKMLKLPKRIVSDDVHNRFQKGLKNMSAVYEGASKMSIYCRQRADWAMKCIFILGLLMLLAIEIYSNPPWTETRPTALLLAYYLCFVMAFMLYLYVSWRKYHNRYLDYRALAEALRVQIYWQLGGISKSVADFYSRKHRREMEWIRSGIRALCTYNWVADQEDIEIVTRYWVEKQRRYFQENADKNRRRHQFARRSATLLLILGLLTGLVLFAFSHGPGMEKTLIILMVFFPALGAAAGGYAEKMGYDFHSKQYETMTRIFTRAKNALKAHSEKSSEMLTEFEKADTDRDRREEILTALRVDQPKQRKEMLTKFEAAADNNKERREILTEIRKVRSKEILTELGKAALEENSDWVLLHRERPVELPK